MNFTSQRHPKVFWYLCNIAFWDGYFNFALITLLVVYLTQMFGFSDHKAYALYGIFLSISYTMPLLAGWVSDRLISGSKAIIYANIFIMIGCVMLALPHPHYVLFGALFLIAWGVGLIKANSNGLLSKLYPHKSKAQEQGYTWLYAAMNVGAIAGPILLSWIASHYSWSLGFLVSGTFFAISLVLYLTQYRFIREQERPHLQLAWDISVIWQAVLMLVGTVVLIVVLALLVIIPVLFNVFVALIIALAVYAFYTEWRKAPKTSWRPLLFLLMLYVFMMMFFITEFQVGGALAMFATRQIGTLHLGSFSIPAQSTAALLPLFVALGAFVVNPLMNKVQADHTAFRLMFRVFIGLLLAALAFLLFFDSASSSREIDMGLMIGSLVLGYLLLGVAEILIAPTALAATGHMIDKSRQSTFMGVYYLFAALAGYLAGKVSSIGQIDPSMVTDRVMLGLIYSKIFMLLAIGMLGVCLIAGLILLGMRLLQR